MRETSLFSCYKQVLEIVFPPSHDELLLRASDPALFRDVTLIQSQKIFHCLPYRTPAVSAAIHLAKFHHHHDALVHLASTLCAIQDQFPADAYWLPIPLSKKRQRERGYNQVTEILTVARRQSPSLTVRTDLLRRVRHTAPQTSLNKTKRRHNLSGAFVATNPTAITDQHLVVVDDVTTTGATLEAAHTALSPHGPASITLLALAH